MVLRGTGADANACLLHGLKAHDVAARHTAPRGDPLDARLRSVAAALRAGAHAGAAARGAAAGQGVAQRRGHQRLEEQRHHQQGRPLFSVDIS